MCDGIVCRSWAFSDRESTRRLRYIADPVCVACLIIYPINRWCLKPHHIGGWFTHGYLNDVMCLPLFLPMILYGQRLIGLRQHDGWPRWWEMLQHWVIFSTVFEVVLPRMPGLFAHTKDPWNVVAYLAGGVLAEIYWKTRARLSPRDTPPSLPGRPADPLPRRF